MIQIWIKKIVYLYMILMFSLFLFIFQDYYFNITSTKWNCFFLLTSVTAMIIIVLNIIDFIRQKKHISIQNIYLSLSLTDKCMILLLISHMITTILSNNVEASFLGSSGRNTGLLFTIMIACAYSMISRYYAYQQSITLVFLGSCSIMSLIALMNFIGIDFIGFFTHLSDYQSNLFISTSGNIDIFSSIINIAIPFCMVLYCGCKTKTSTIIYAIFTACSFVGLLVSNSDGAYLGFFLGLLGLFYFCIREYQSLIRFFHILFIFLIEAKLLYFLNDTYNFVRYFHTISFMFTSSNITWYLLVSIGLCYIYIIRNKNAFSNQEILNNVKRYSTYTLIILGVITAIFILIINLLDIHIPVLSNYITFNKDWGTGRFMIWEMFLQAYISLQIPQLIFGYGLDSSRLLIGNYISSDLAIYDNAHNEYIQYLVTSGIVGLLIYLGIFVSLIKRLYNKCYSSPYGFAIILVLFVYLIEAFVSVNQPISTPLIFLFLGIGEAMVRQNMK